MVGDGGVLPARLSQVIVPTPACHGATFAKSMHRSGGSGGRKNALRSACVRQRGTADDTRATRFACAQPPQFQFGEGRPTRMRREKSGDRSASLRASVDAGERLEFRQSQTEIEAAQFIKIPGKEAVHYETPIKRQNSAGCSDHAHHRRRAAVRKRIIEVRFDGDLIRICDVLSGRARASSADARKR